LPIGVRLSAESKKIALISKKSLLKERRRVYFRQEQSEFLMSVAHLVVFPDQSSGRKKMPVE
jgi:hypothetical protein